MSKPYYLTYVVGDRGVGKTTLLAHFATQLMIPPFSISDLQQCRAEIARLQAGGWDELSLEPHVKHLVYVVEETFIAKGLGYRPRISMQLPFDKIGLFDGVHEVYYLLPYAKIFMPEIQSKLDSRKSVTADRVADYFLRYIERQRKVGVQMWADTQIDDSADKRFRFLADKLIEVQKQEHFYNKQGALIRTVWTCLEFAGMKPYLRYKDTGSLSEANSVEYTHVGNIFECVDSFSGKEYFYDGMEGNFYTELAEMTSNNKESMLAKCRKFPLFNNDESRKDEVVYGEEKF